jgi:DNA processing protein
VTFLEALAHFGSAQEACASLATVGDTTIVREEAALAALGGRFVVWGDPHYPRALAATSDPPPVLSAIGDLGLLARPTLAIVGGREASLAGRRFAADLAATLGSAGHVIASGLARGIDAAAHEAALPTGTVAVLACGLDQVYPPQNASLQDAIATCGLLLSECALGVPPIARAFPRRNRIVSGLSAGVIVIEAAAKSGSLITAQRAAEQGREVFVVPGSPMDPRHAGSNSLIRDGAILVRDANDIVSVVGRSRSMSQPIEKSLEIHDDALTATVVSALGPVPTAVDELVRRCQVSAASVAEVLFSLELEGRLERHRGNRVSLI